MNQETGDPGKNRSATAFSHGFMVARFEYKEELI
jgi:hypothetical protein